MDSASNCVYNVTRNALLSERVISVSEPQTPSQLLALVMNGPGRDPHFCVRLTNVSMVPEIPRLFAFDVAYLDAEQRIIQVADVGPGTPFPPLLDGVASILFLSDQLLAKSNTEVGDYIRICSDAELAALLRASAQFHAVESPGWPIEAAAPVVSSASEPFDGSLIFLPASGTPQAAEIFLPKTATLSAAINPSLENAPDELPAEISASSSQLDTGAAQPVLEEPAPYQERETEIEEPEQPPSSSTQIPPVARFFETPSHQPPSPEAPPDEAHPSSSPQPSQLPFSLKAVIQRVEEQLRREKEQQDQPVPQQLPDKSSDAVNVGFPQFFDLPKVEEPSPKIEEPSPQSSQLFLTPAQEESTETAPDLSTASIPQLPDTADTAIHGVEPADAPALPAVTSEQIAAAPPPSPQKLTPVPKRPEPSIFLAPAQTPDSAQKAAPRPIPPPQAEPAPLREPPPSPAPPSPEVQRATRNFPKEKLPFAARVQRWLAGESVSLSGNRRRGERMEVPGLVAFYFTGGAPKPHEIVNISTSGLYLRGKELWSPNTLVRMTLERPDSEIDEKKSISVLARVVRIDDGGIGHEFVTTEVLANLRARDFLPQQGTNRKELEKFLAIPR